MKNCLFLILFAIVSDVCTVEGSNVGRDEKLFNAFVDEIRGTNLDIESFVDVMWPVVAGAVPRRVTVPAVEIFSLTSGDYLCSRETEIRPRVGQIYSKKVVNRTERSIEFEIEAELLLKPVIFDIAKTVSPASVTSASPVIYAFNVPNKVRFRLEIPNFINERSILTPQCSVTVTDILITEMSEPILVNIISSERLKGIESRYWNNVHSQMRIVFTIGLLRAMDDHLNAGTDSWVCPSSHLSSAADRYKAEWKYTYNYFKYCLTTK